ncbi:MAG: putative O-methyltransferase YrrM [Candidatus Azotimanducaceae bacterium]|jgi:predicted O-methyltransferase YrrM
MQLPINVDSVKGFLSAEEGSALYERCRETCAIGPALEIGSYCGKSTVYLGQACKEAMSTLFALDHHRGSEEHQLGEEYHDPELYDAGVGKMDTFKLFRDTVSRAKLDDHVVPLVAGSAVVARNWQTPLGMVFIDGGHSLEAAQTDYACWSVHVARGGILAIHDLFPDPSTGGQAPITIWREALASGLFEDVGVVGTLGVLRRRDS